MSEPLLNKVQCLSPAGLHHMAYWEWGERDNPRVLVCVHGLSRQGRDFDRLAQAMSREYRVICPDVVGRGRSDWLANPALYQVPTYVADMVTLIARLDVEQVHWVGTSMGGLIGMGLAALPKSPITRLVLNDVGPAIEFEAIRRIGSYLGQPLSFDSLEQGAEYLRSVSQTFGPHSDADWLALSKPMLHADGTGRLKLHYDPSIAVPIRAATPELTAAGEALLWQSYERIACPTLLLRGADSDLLSRATAEAMMQRGPRAQLCEFAGVGHAPTLVALDQIDAVRQFLLASP